jgi:heme/copper-type cytochrome/quinol oxidase subunit 2
MRTPTLSDHLTVDVTGHVYWWEMSYRRPDGLAAVTSANELLRPGQLLTLRAGIPHGVEAVEGATFRLSVATATPHPGDPKPPQGCAAQRQRA